PQEAAAISLMQAMKTGALIRFACEAGALLGGAEAHERASLVVFGETIGRAFQLADDLIDATGAAAQAGKATAKDAGQGKATLVGLYGVEDARRRLDEAIVEAVSALAPFGERAGVLADAARFIAAREA